MKSKLHELQELATKRSRYWISDAVANSDDISEAADDFVVENGKGSTVIVNAMLVELGHEPIFPE